MKKIKLKNIDLGPLLIESGEIIVDKFTIIKGSLFKSEILELIHSLVEFEHEILKIYKEEKLSVVSLNKTGKLRRLLYKKVPGMASCHLRCDESFISFESDLVSFIILKEKEVVVSSILPEDEIPYEGINVFFPLNRFNSLDFLSIKFNKSKEDPNSYFMYKDEYWPYTTSFKKLMVSIIEELLSLVPTSRKPGSPASIPVYHTNEFVVSADMRGFFLGIRTLAHHELPSEIKYSLPIYLVINRRLADTVVDSIFIDLPEQGMDENTSYRFFYENFIDGTNPETSVIFSSNSTKLITEVSKLNNSSVIDIDKFQYQIRL